MPIAAVVLYGYAFCVCPLAGECPLCREGLTPGYVCWAAQGVLCEARGRVTPADPL